MPSYVVKVRWHPKRWEAISYLSSPVTAIKHYDSLVLQGRDAALFHQRRRLTDAQIQSLRRELGEPAPEKEGE